ncbi:MAG: methylenetetrahydrofolate--tRNA-(uracil(54)-C(5))-methyltransferase (FADH(2)-oxidizing) TrmFO [Clostridiales bacterium]|nr:methylenetetrahydrofolate--tRNA-(uracil(54)-C(5))-methyltransferase (FADH(2)-oxidizing) TrmFO [Candidatus Apopatousia equi]
MEKLVNVIGAGLAGSECAYQLAKYGIKVRLYEQKPTHFSPAHSSENFAELVCSNSLKSNELTNACGLLKEEMRLLDSLIIRCADKARVPAGASLSVDRELFSKLITDEIKNNKNIEVISKQVEDIDENEITVIATGPLTSDKLSTNLAKLIGEESLYFFDAAAPIVSLKSLDESRYFVGNRYEKSNEQTSGDYVNCTMTKDEYDVFYNELISAKTVELHDFENSKVFEGCMPVEVMAKRGYQTLLYGMLKPVGLYDEKHNMKPYAVLQLRKESNTNDLYNLVGFQTNLLFGEQKRVFSLIPALKNAEFVKYGVMHKNTFINAPKVLNNLYQVKNHENVYIIGQLSGVEGYVESTASGLNVALNIVQRLKGKSPQILSSKTSIGSLINFISSSSPDNFQPMNSNWGIMQTVGTKKDRKVDIENSLNEIKDYLSKL